VVTPKSSRQRHPPHVLAYARRKSATETCCSGQLCSTRHTLSSSSFTSSCSARHRTFSLPLSTTCQCQPSRTLQHLLHISRSVSSTCRITCQSLQSMFTPRQPASSRHSPQHHLLPSRISLKSLTDFNLKNKETSIILVFWWFINTK